MKISPEIEWIRDFVELVSPLVPNIDMLDSIKSRRPKDTCTENQTFLGQITKYYNGKNHLITLYTHYLHFTIKKNDIIEIEIRKYSHMDVLKCLAHELSHLAHWEHTPFHWALEISLNKMFATKLAIDGYESEDKE